MTKRILFYLNSFLTIMIFVVLIYIPFTIGFIEEDIEISNIEKRTLSKFPSAPKNSNDIKQYPEQFDAYYADHFGLRDWLLGVYKSFKYSLGDSPSEDVTIGKDGWLFLGSVKKAYTRYSDPMGDVRNANLYSIQDLAAVANYLTHLKSWLNKQGIEYLLIIAPNKHTIYFEYLPDYIQKINPHSATDQLVDYLQQHTNISVIDLRNTLTQEKDKHILYYKTGTHWNNYAANIAQYEIIREIEKLFPQQIQAEKFQLKNATNKGGDLASYMGFHTFSESSPQPVFEQHCTPQKQPAEARETETHTFICNDKTLNAVIFRDSFFSALQPFFARKFKHSTYLWEKSNFPALVKYIQQENPDIVIEEWVERDLPYVPRPFDSPRQ